MRAYPFVALVFLWSLLPVQAQSPAKPLYAEIRLDDGSIVRAALTIDAVPITTKYGKLLVPLRDIRRIEFGLHLPPGHEEAITRAIKRLASNAHKERVAAGGELVDLGHFAGPMLRAAAKHPDQEVATRAAEALRLVGERAANDLINLPEHDIIHTADMPIVGRIDLTTLKCTSAHLGELELPVAAVRQMRLRTSGERTEIVVDAAKHGEQWCDTGLVLDKGQNLVLAAEGQVELWPQAPGQYVAQPKGYNVAGKGGQFMAGALVGRVGETGKTFFIGERFEGAAPEEGRLFLQITPSPWNNTSSGSYRVRVQQGR